MYSKAKKYIAQVGSSTKKQVTFPPLPVVVIVIMLFSGVDLSAKLKERFQAVWPSRMCRSSGYKKKLLPRRPFPAAFERHIQ